MTDNGPKMTPERFDRFDKILLKMAGDLAEMSLATRSKVGALIVKDGRIVSMGWNGMPSGFPNDELEITDAQGVVTTNPLVVHAEANAINKCAAFPGSSTEGATLYVTMSPCVECAKNILSSKIKRVVFRDLYRISDSLTILERGDVKVERIKAEDLEKDVI